MPMTFDVGIADLADKLVAPAYRLQSQRPSSIHRSVRALLELVGIDSGLYIRGYSQTGTPYYRVDNVRGLVSNESFGDVALVSKSRAATIPDRCRCTINDVIISRTGTLGKAFLALGRHEGAILSQHVTRLSIRDSSVIMPGFLTLYLNSPEGKHQLISLGSGSTRLELTHSDIEKVQVPILPIVRQTYFHDVLVSLLTQYYEAISHLEYLHQSINRMLGVTAIAPRSQHFDALAHSLDRLWLPQRYRPEFAAALSRVLDSRDHIVLGDHFNFQRGKGTIAADYVKFGIPFVRTSSLANYCIDPFPDHYASEETYAKYRQTIESDVILYSIEGRIGHSALVDATLPVVTKNHIEQLRLRRSPNQIPDDVFIGWVLAVLRCDLGAIQVSANKVTQSTIPGLASRLREFIVPLPEESELPVASDYYSTCKDLLRATASLRTLYAEFREETGL